MGKIERLNQAIRVLKDYCFEHNTNCDGCELRDFCDAINDGWNNINEKAGAKMDEGEQDEN